ARGPACEDRLTADEAATADNAFAVPHENVVVDPAVGEQRRHPRRAQPGDVALARGRAENLTPQGIDRDDLRPQALFPYVFRTAANGAAGARGAEQVIRAAVEGGGDLAHRRPPVGADALGVGVLVGPEAVGDRHQVFEDAAEA